VLSYRWDYKNDNECDSVEQERYNDEAALSHQFDDECGNRSIKREPYDDEAALSHQFNDECGNRSIKREPYDDECALSYQFNDECGNRSIKREPYDDECALSYRLDFDANVDNEDDEHSVCSNGDGLVKTSDCGGMQLAARTGPDTTSAG